MAIEVDELGFLTIRIVSRVVIGPLGFTFFFVRVTYK